MKGSLIGLFVVLCGTAIPNAQDPGIPVRAVAPEDPAACGEIPDRKDLDTSLLWYDSIETACAQARRENKLVLALHVSGYFDNRALT
jgi:hypothetical protein